MRIVHPPSLLIDRDARNRDGRTGPAGRRAMPHARVQRRLSVLAVCLVVLISVSDWLIIGMQRESAIDDYRIATTNIVNGMIAQKAPWLLSVDAVLRDMREILAPAAGAAPDEIAASLRARETQDRLAARFMRLAGIDALMVVDAGGHVANAVRARSGREDAGRDVSESDYFRALGAADQADTFVGSPVRNPETGRWTASLARRLNDAKGAFAGVVLAEVSLDDLADFLRVAMPPRRTLTIARRDGTVLMRSPAEPGIAGQLLPPDSPWYRTVAAGGGAYLGTSFPANAEILAVLRPLPHLPIVFEASVAQVEVFKVWRQQRTGMIAGGFAAAVIAVCLIRLFARQIRRLDMRNIELDDARRKLDLAMANISQGMCFFNGRLRLIVCNRRYGEIYGLPPAAMQPGVALAEIIHHTFAAGGPAGVTEAEFLAACAATALAAQPHQSVIEMVDGRTIAVQQQPMPDGGWVATHEDISERRRAEDRIAFMARHDVLTGLPNRSLLRERIGEAIAQAKEGSRFALLFLDLDHFKAVNDTLGHAAGDELLCAVAGRLKATLRPGDTVARLGGDEFVVLQCGVRRPDDAAVLAARIIETISAPFQIAGQDVLIGVSIGVELAMDEGYTPDALLKNADLALYASKSEGRGTFRFFEVAMGARIENRHTIESDLRRAIERGEFELRYQPVVCADSLRTCGFEALLHWNHPVRGTISPPDFIAVAEESGLIIPIGAWAIGQACRDAALWPPGVHVSVNLSPVQFSAANLVAVVQDALAASGLAAERLALEITESVLLDGREHSPVMLHQLRDLGVVIVLDDFGMSYSSLATLRSFPFGRIKIDRSFIRDLSVRSDAVYVVRAILALCRDLGIRRTTAAGVETAAQRDILVAEGCSELQGYLFGRPRPVFEIKADPGADPDPDLTADLGTGRGGAAPAAQPVLPVVA